MLFPAIAIGAVLLVLVSLYVLDDAMRLLTARTGNPYNEQQARWTRWLVWGIAFGIIVIICWPSTAPVKEEVRLATIPPPVAPRYTPDSLWLGPDTASIAGLDATVAGMVHYGRDLIANTSKYLGPQGSVDHRTNGMNCQNCHLDAGSRPWGNNYGAVWSTYPKFRERSGAIESVVKRVNDCVERSLNGTALDSTSREMQAILAYMQWIGTDVPKGQKPKGTGILDLGYLDRPADPSHGAKIFSAKCITCHEADGHGKRNVDGITYQYPPLWGPNSFNIGAGLFRLSRAAGYIKANMPQGSTWDRPQLSDEEAWDVAAFINSQQRPDRDLSKDWPKLAAKPVDHPFGPYADGFTQEQHKYGPFGPIAEARKKK